MRDVTNSDPSKEALQKLKETAQFLVQFLRNPLKEITHLPDWSWTRLLIVQVLLSMGSGILSGLIPPNVYRIAAGIFIAPIVSTTMAFLMGLFLYYFFQIVESRTVSLRKLITLVLLANVPFFVFEVGSELLPPITLIGFAMTSVLLVIGLVENFQLDKKKAFKVVGGILAVVFIIWLWNRIEVARM